jgi:hypothetical protein
VAHESQSSGLLLDEMNVVEAGGSRHTSMPFSSVGVGLMFTAAGFDRSS